MSNESLLVILVVGLVAGRLAGQIVRGSGFGIIGDLVIGILGAFVGNWLLLQLGVHVILPLVFLSIVLGVDAENDLICVASLFPVEQGTKTCAKNAMALAILRPHSGDKNETSTLRHCGFVHRFNYSLC